MSASSCGSGFDCETGRCGPWREEAFVVADRRHLGALDAFDQDFDVAVGQLQALDDVDDGADLVDLVRLGLVDGGVVLGGEKIFLSPASASSSARTLDSRPTTNGVIMYGKMTTSRMGIIGSLSCIGFFLRCESLSLWGTGNRARFGYIERKSGMA